jgi:hypothetical protein
MRVSADRCKPFATHALAQTFLVTKSERSRAGGWLMITGSGYLFSGNQHHELSDSVVSAGSGSQEGC